MPSRDRAPKSICASGGNELQLMRPFEAEEGAFQQLWRFLTTFLSGSSSLPLQHAARRPSDLGSAVWQMDDMDLVERPSGYSERLEGLFAAAKLGESKWTSTTSSLDQMPSNRLSCCVGTTADEEASQTPRMSTRWSVARTRMSERGAAANALLSTFQSTVRQSLNLSRLRRSEAQQPAEACRPAWAAYRGQRPRGSNRERSSRSTDEEEADSAVELPVDDAAAERPPAPSAAFTSSNGGEGADAGSAPGLPALESAPRLHQQQSSGLGSRMSIGRCALLSALCFPMYFARHIVVHSSYHSIASFLCNVPVT